MTGSFSLPCLSYILQAAQARKTIGTMAWLFLVQSSGVFTNPMDQLLHFPVPKRQIDGFANQVRHNITFEIESTNSWC